MGRLTLRLPASLHEQVSALAKRDGVSVNQWLVYAVSAAVAAPSRVRDDVAAEALLHHMRGGRSESEVKALVQGWVREAVAKPPRPARGPARQKGG